MPNPATSGSSDAVVAVRAVSKSILRRAVLKDVSFELRPASATLLLGANGAGKSTLLRLLAGLSRADGGTIEFGGFAKRAANLNQIGYLGHQLMLYARLSVAQNITLAIKLCGLRLNLDEYLDQWGLVSCRDREIDQLSRGQQFRTALARAFVSSPKYILLDEPSSSLDDTSIRLLATKIKATVESGGIALIATHDLSRIKPLASAALLLDQGKLVGQAQSSSEIEALIAKYQTANR